MTQSRTQATSRRRAKFAVSAVALLATIALFAAACGSDDDSTSDATTTQAPAAAPAAEQATTTTTAAPPDDDLGLGLGETTTTVVDSGATPTTTMMDPCEAETPEATEIGVSEDKITVLVMADIGSPLAPGLFQGSRRCERLGRASKRKRRFGL